MDRKLNWDYDDTPEEKYTTRRHRMVEEQLSSRDISDQRVLDAMRSVPRHRFIPEGSRPAAYKDRPLQIGCGQTISQPYVVASMTEHLQLKPESRVLEIGTGCGYQTAILAELAGRVYTIEIVGDLLEQADEILPMLGYDNIETRVGDGSLGWPEEAPFDAIIVTAAAPRIPDILVKQLVIGGFLVLPLSTDPYSRQFLTRIRRTESGIMKETLYEVRFVPMVGKVEGK